MMLSVSTEAEDKDDDQSERDQRRRRTPTTQINIDVIDDSGDDILVYKESSGWTLQRNELPDTRNV